MELKEHLLRRAIAGPPRTMDIMNYLHLEIPETHLSSDLDCVYHYTDLDGFFHMVSSREFWISNVNYLNDRQEMQDGISKCVSVIQEMLGGGNLTPMQKDFLYHLLSRIEQGESDGSWAVSQADVFAMSFCSGSDLLTQWRAYGARGGIAIGFDITRLMNECRLRQAAPRPQSAAPAAQSWTPARELLVPVLQKVVYDDTVKEDIIQRIFAFGFSLLKEDDPARFHMTCAAFSDVLLRYLPLFKHNSFFSEAEMRYVYTRSRGGKPDYAVDFRPRGGLILPFLRFQLLNQEGQALASLPIRQIIVGPSPQQKDVVDSIRYYLRNSGNPDLIYGVKASSIPYRG